MTPISSIIIERPIQPAGATNATAPTSSPTKVVVSRGEVNERARVGDDHGGDDAVVVAELKWSVLPAALQRAVGVGEDDARVWVSEEGHSYFGMTILKNSTEGGEGACRLNGWVMMLEDGSGDEGEGGGERGPIRRSICEFAEEKSREPGRAKEEGAVGGRGSGIENRVSFEVLNGRPDRISIDVTDGGGGAICRLTYVVGSGGRVLWWAHSILPEVLGLNGGQYELCEVIVEGLAKWSD